MSGHQELRSAITTAAVYAVAVAEFHITTGVHVQSVFPAASLDEPQRRHLAELAMPEGIHRHEQDWSFFIMEAEQTVYGVSLFRSTADAAAQRGAQQRSIVLLLRRPALLQMATILELVFDHIGVDDLDQQLSTVYDTLTYAFDHPAAPTQLFGATLRVPFHVEPLVAAYLPALDTLSLSADGPCQLTWTRDPFPGTHLAPLITTFRHDIIKLWKAMLLGKRIGVYGESARTVGACVLALTSSVLPLDYPAQRLRPHLFLADESDLPSWFIAGITNPMMREREALFDVLADTTTGTIIGDIPLSIKEFALARRLCSQMDRCSTPQDKEVHARHFFQEATTRMIQQTMQQRKQPGCNVNMDLFAVYTEHSMDHAWALQAIQSLDCILYGGENDTMDAFKQCCSAASSSAMARHLLRLYGAEPCLVMGMLYDDAEIRKHALTTLSLLVGGAAVLDEDLVSMMVDKSVSLCHCFDPDVVLATLLLYQAMLSHATGRHALVSNTLLLNRFSILLLEPGYRDDIRTATATLLLDLVQRTSCTLTLTASAEHLSPTASYFEPVLELLDILDIRLRHVPMYAELQRLAVAATSDDEARVEAALGKLCQRSDVHDARQMAQSCSVRRLEELIHRFSENQRIQVRVWMVFMVMSLSRVGARRLLADGIVARAVVAVLHAETLSPSSLLAAFFIELAAQHPLLESQLFRATDGARLLTKVINETPLDRLPITFPLLRALHHLVLCRTQEDDLTSTLAPLSNLETKKEFLSTQTPFLSLLSSLLEAAHIPTHNTLPAVPSKPSSIPAPKRLTHLASFAGSVFNALRRAQPLTSQPLLDTILHADPLSRPFSALPLCEWLSSLQSALH